MSDRYENMEPGNTAPVRPDDDDQAPDADVMESESGEQADGLDVMRDPAPESRERDVMAADPEHGER
jgi:hypothetical protein